MYLFLRVQYFNLLIFGLFFVQNGFDLKRETLSGPKFVGYFTEPIFLNGIHGDLVSLIELDFLAR